MRLALYADYSPHLLMLLAITPNTRYSTEEIAKAFYLD